VLFWGVRRRGGEGRGGRFEGGWGGVGMGDGGWMDEGVLVMTADAARLEGRRVGVLTRSAVIPLTGV